jgi:hypothetical protein
LSLQAPGSYKIIYSRGFRIGDRGAFKVSRIAEDLERLASSRSPYRRPRADFQLLHQFRQPQIRQAFRGIQDSYHPVAAVLRLAPPLLFLNRFDPAPAGFARSVAAADLEYRLRIEDERLWISPEAKPLLKTGFVGRACELSRRAARAGKCI